MSRTRRRRPLAAPAVLALLAVLAVLPTGPLLAYTIYLKDGSKIVAKEKYRLAGKRAIITLPNGTQTFLDAAQIDVARSEVQNRTDYGSAVVIEGGEAKANAAPPAAKERTLADLIESRKTQEREQPAPRREPKREASGSLLKTKAGYLDLSTLPIKPFAQLDAAAELQQFFRSQGLEEIEIYQGSQPDRPLVEVVANSEAGVFRTLTVAANALLRLRETHPRVGGLELLMSTAAKQRAGQFVLTPQMAADVVAKSVDVSVFYLNHVQF